MYKYMVLWHHMPSLNIVTDYGLSPVHRQAATIYCQLDH